ncbi:MAG: tetratricopeptide repeat protein [Acidobacteriota bacterium]|nr:tetratricopeptide repeat protein [Acidobacteriota bacterium]
MRTHLSRNIAVVVTLFAMLSIPMSAQLRGRGRVEGSVVDKATGKPVAKATVTISSETVTKPVVTKTNAKGAWSALGLTSGTWTIVIEADGYQVKRISVPVGELVMLPPIHSELETKVAVANIGDEVVEAVNQAQDLMSAMAGDPVAGGAAGATVTAEDVKANHRKAAALLEALPQIPGETEERQHMRTQIQQLLAQAQYEAGDVDQAIETLSTLVAADVKNHENALLLVNLYLEAGKMAEGKALLEKLPAGAVSDPTVFLNAGIGFLNNESFEDAAAYFEKAIALDAGRHEGYYYRGLAQLQLQKTAEAKADFEKVLAMAPDGPEAEEARQLLAGLK